MLFLLVKFYGILKFNHKTIDACTDKTSFLCVVNDLLVLTFLATDNRSNQCKLCSFVPGKNRVDDLVNGLFLDFTAALGTVGFSYSCKKQTVIVIDFRYCSNCGTRIFVGRFLLNGNGRRKSRNKIHIRLVHPSKKLPGI